MPHVVIRLAEDHAANAARFDLFDRIKQVHLGGNAEHNQVAPVFGQVEPAPGFQAGVANLDDLVSKWDIGTNQDIGVPCRQLQFRH
ncbi:MAG: hypothetical protein JW850_07490 [Thermoflexales bacterium]|nr:hypothetical protein [Thermoflexales bacterium]